MTDERWDVVVAGAGPAGAVAALGAARAGLRTLLVDREPFPRWKVCGACLNAAALEVMEWAGVEGLLQRVGAPGLRDLWVAGWGREVAIPLRRSVALSRRALDPALVEAAAGAGARVRTARIAGVGRVEGGWRHIRLERGGSSVEVRARSLVVATGLTPLPAAEEGGAGTGIRIAPTARVGVGAVLPASTDGFPPGRIHMVVGPAGYVGLVRQEDGSLDVAGALDPEWIRVHGGLEDAVREHLRGAGRSLAPAEPIHGWRGTPPLTRSTVARAGDRFFRVGDAAGYVEPFTGEGMAWAMAGGRLLTPLLVAAAREWDPRLAMEWERRHRRGVASRQRVCRVISWISRRPVLARATLDLARGLPRGTADIAHWTARPFSFPPLGAPVP